uniref:Uncharacterized protein n=1 Tax=Panagrolaimus davidi TaxID=227884 RepID=A0A914QC09_9BILA
MEDIYDEISGITLPSANTTPDSGPLPSPSKKYLSSVTDDMIRDPEKYEGVKTKSIKWDGDDSWPGMREFFKSRLNTRVSTVCDSTTDNNGEEIISIKEEDIERDTTDNDKILRFKYKDINFYFSYSKDDIRYFLCKDCRSISDYLDYYSKSNNCRVQIPIIGYILYDTKTKLFYANPRGPGGETHACQNPDYQHKTPIIVAFYEDRIIKGQEVKHKPEHAAVLEKLRECVPTVENEYGGVFYFIVRLKCYESEYFVSSPNSYVGYTTIETNEQSMFKRFYQHLEDKKYIAKINGTDEIDEMYMIECFRGTTYQAEQLEYLYLAHKDKLEHGGTTLVNINPGLCRNKLIKDLSKPTHPFNKTLIAGLNQMIEHCIKNGDKLCASDVFMSKKKAKAN